VISYLTALVLLIVPVATAAQNYSLPDIGDPSREILGAGEESRLGRAIFERLIQTGIVIEDPLLQEYVESVGQQVATHAFSDNAGFVFFMVNDSSINAFAAPGGYIGVNTGLLMASRSESELAGVLAHEVAHVTQRHIARQFEDQTRMRIPMAAAMLAGALLASQGGGDAGAAAITGVMAVDAQRQINFTRRHESEADRVGVDLLVKTDFDPQGLPDFFQRLYEASRVYGTNVPEFLRTHPVESRRIAETRDRIEQIGGGKRRRDPLDYYVAQARARVLSSQSPDRLADQFAEAIRTGSHRDVSGQRYGQALSLMRAGHMDRAREQSARLLDTHPEYLPFLLLAAEIELQAGSTDAAIERYREAESLYPGDFTLALSHGSALIQAGRYRSAMNVLRGQLQNSIVRSTAYAQYARAARGAGMRAESHASMATYYSLRGGLRLAIEQTELALGSADVTPYQRSRLQAQLESLRNRSAEEDA